MNLWLPFALVFYFRHFKSLYHVIILPFLVKTGEDRLSFFSSFGQEGVVKQILYDVGGGGGGGGS